MSMHRIMVKKANELADRQAKLSDEDWAIHAIYVLGGLTRELIDYRGTMAVRWLHPNSLDVTQCMIRLERAGLTTDAYNEEMRALIARKLEVLLVRKQRRLSKGKP